MRTTNYMILLAVPLALAACDRTENTDEPTETTMANGMSSAESTQMSDDMPMMNGAAIGQFGSGEGSVTKIDEAEDTITINHGPIPAVGWPAMTMAFDADKESLGKVSIGDRVTFEFRTAEAGGGELTAIARK